MYAASVHLRIVSVGVTGGGQSGRSVAARGTGMCRGGNRGSHGSIHMAAFSGLGLDALCGYGSQATVAERVDPLVRKCLKHLYI